MENIFHNSLKETTINTFISVFIIRVSRVHKAYNKAFARYKEKCEKEMSEKHKNYVYIGDAYRYVNEDNILGLFEYSNRLNSIFQERRKWSKSTDLTIAVNIPIEIILFIHDMEELFQIGVIE